MQAIFELAAELRTDKGKGASRRLRRTQDQVPGIVYGGNQAPTSIQLDQKKLMRALEVEAFYSHLLTLHLPNHKKQQVVLKALQRHPFKKALLHVDFQRVSANDVITMRVPLHFINEQTAPGVKKGGQVNHHLIDVEIRCKASALPEYIEVDLSEAALDTVIHLSDLVMPKGAECVALHQGSEFDMPVLSIHLPRTFVEETEPPTPPPAA